MAMQSLRVNEKACFGGMPKQASMSGGDGIRTRDLLNAIQTRSQLRHAPKKLRNLFDAKNRLVKLSPSCRPVNLSRFRA